MLLASRGPCTTCCPVKLLGESPDTYYITPYLTLPLSPLILPFPFSPDILESYLLITFRLWKHPPNFGICQKAFDRVWHEGLLYKLKTIGVSDNTFLEIKKKIIGIIWIIDIKDSYLMVKILIGNVLQGSILIPLLFLIYINDLPNNLIPNVMLFADDTSIFQL